MKEPNAAHVAQALREAGKDVALPDPADRDATLAFVAAMRQTFEAEQGAIPAAADISVDPLVGAPFSGEVYRPRHEAGAGCILYHHGGGQVFGSAASHRHLVTRLASASRTMAWSIDYPLAPEHPFPAGMEAGVQSYCHLLATGIAPQRIVVAGDSGGATLTMAMVLALKDRDIPLPGGIFLISPFLDLTLSHETHRTLAAKEPWATPEMLRFCIEAVAGDTPHGDPFLSPLLGDLSGLPPLFVQVGTNEVLLGDSLRLTEKAAVSGSDVLLHIYSDMFHAWHLFHPVLTEAGPRAIAEAGEWIARMVQQD